MSKSLQMKMALLQNLQKGDIGKSHQLIGHLCQSTKSNLSLYEKFNSFLTENKKGLIEMEEQERKDNENQEVIIQNIEDNVQDSFNSDESWSLSGSENQSEQEEKVKKISNKKKVLQVGKGCKKCDRKQVNIKKEALRH